MIDLEKGAEITVSGYGVSRTMPDLITISVKTYLEKVNPSEIEEPNNELMLEFKKWSITSEVFEDESVSMEKIDSSEAEKVVSITTSQLDNLDKLAKLLENYGQIMGAKYSLSDAKRKEEEKKALMQALEDAEKTVSAMGTMLNTRISRIKNIEVSTDSMSDTPSTISTFETGRILSSSIETAVRVTVTYIAGE